MSVGAILTLGLGSPFSDIALLPTLGYLSGVVNDVPGGGTSRRRRGRVRRHSDPDEPIREPEAVMAALTPLEQAAVNLGEARTEQEIEEDEIILMTLMKVLH